MTNEVKPKNDSLQSPRTNEKEKDVPDVIQKMTTPQLRKEILWIEKLVYDIDCFGTRDLIYLELLGRELQRRMKRLQDIKHGKISNIKK